MRFLFLLGAGVLAMFGTTIMGVLFWRLIISDSSTPPIEPSVLSAFSLCACASYLGAIAFILMARSTED